MSKQFLPEQSKAEHMAAYCSAGFAIFPLKQDRSPAVCAWQKLEPKSFSAYNLGRFPYGYGIALKGTDFVIDYDPRNDTTRDHEGGGSLQRLWKVLQLERAETYIVRTGRDGLHIYFTVESGLKFKRDLAKAGFPGVEIKAKGHYVIGPGSPHPQGHDYYVVRHSVDTILPVPEALKQFCLRSVSPASEPTKQPVVANDKVTQKRFVRYCIACEAAVEGQGGDRRTLLVAAEGKDYGLDADIVYDIMSEHFNPRCEPPWSEEELKKKVDNAFRYLTENVQGASHPAHLMANDPPLNWDLNEKGTKLLGTLHNGLNFFALPLIYKPLPLRRSMTGPPTEKVPNELYQLIRYNLFSNQIEFTRAAPWHQKEAAHKIWQDNDSKQLKAWLAANCFFQPALNIVEEVVTVAAAQNPYHPVKDWLESLRWDGTPRLDTMLVRYAGTADSPYVREVTKNTMLAAVARIYDPGIKYDYMMILEGAQGLGKTEFVKALGGQWYADVKIDLANGGASKDTIHAMQGAWILEASEMEFMRKTDVGALKRFLSIAVDKVRLSYGRHPSILPRQSIFIGTVNPSTEGYLRDVTGNRRFLPVACSKFNLPAFKIDREQLFAEAVCRFKLGEAYYITDETIAGMAVQEQYKRMETDSWDETVANWLTAIELNGFSQPLTTDFVAYNALNLIPARFGRTEKIRLCQALRNAGYAREKVWSKELRTRIWIWVKDGSGDLSD